MDIAINLMCDVSETESRIAGDKKSRSVAPGFVRLATCAKKCLHNPANKFVRRRATFALSDGSNRGAAQLRKDGVRRCGSSRLSES